MARIVNEKEYAARRNEILDVAQRLIYTKGYEQMSIQDILVEMQMSKGAFYHYFDSKPQLIQALSERMIDESLQFLAPIVDDPELNAIEKLRGYFDTAARWKTARKTLLLAILPVWYHDDNLVMRQKVTHLGNERILPFMTRMIYQGISEGVFNTPYPDQIGKVIMALMISLGDELSKQVFLAVDRINIHNQEEIFQTMENLVAVYTDGFERLLGSTPGSLQFIDMRTLKEWIMAPEEVR